MLIILHAICNYCSYKWKGAVLSDRNKERPICKMRKGAQF